MTTVQNICQIDKAEKCGRIKIEIELDQNPCSNTDNCGSKVKIHIQVSLFSNIRESQDNMWIQEAANLPRMDINGLADAYCMVKIKSKLLSEDNLTILHKTEMKTKTLCPIWNEKLETFLPKELDGTRIMFEGIYQDHP